MATSWAEQVAIRVVLDRVSESPAAIAASTDAFVTAFSARVGATSWEVVDGPPWSGSLENLTEIVRARPSTAALGEPNPADGYTFVLYARREPVALSVGVSIGGRGVGRRLPTENVRGRVMPPAGSAVEPALGVAMLESLIEAYRPLFAQLSTSEVSKAARRGNWKIPAGYRVWLRDGTVTLAWLADGVTARPFAGGTMLSVPDDWPPDLVASRLAETYERNGIDEVPH